MASVHFDERKNKREHLPEHGEAAAVSKLALLASCRNSGLFTPIICLCNNKTVRGHRRCFENPICESDWRNIYRMTTDTGDCNVQEIFVSTNKESRTEQSSDPLPDQVQEHSVRRP